MVGGSQGYRVYDPSGIATTIASQAGGVGAKTGLYAVPVLTPDRAEKRQNGRRFKEDGEDMFTLTGQDRHGVMIKEATKQGYAEAEIGDSINFAVPDSETRRGRVGKGIANTLDTGCQQGVICSGIYTKVSGEFQRGPLEGLSRTLKAKCCDAGVTDGFRIRRLTPKECFRLQGFPDEYFERARAVNSDSQLYRQIGNSVTINVIYEIAKRLE
jgi:DNA (cytosine-5)-methyltransferase 1